MQRVVGVWLEIHMGLSRKWIHAHEHTYQVLCEIFVGGRGNIALFPSPR